MMDINRQTPAYYHTEIFITAPAEMVYETLARLENWPEWQADVKIISVPSEILPEGIFRWTNAGMQITSRILRADSPTRLEWISRSMWIRAHIRWEMEEGNGGTVVRFEQSIQGFGAVLLKPALVNSMETTLLELRKHVELQAVLV
ncbi:SRPBCC family protein [Fulvivirga sedimenti]|uniref:SRPBCC family protein n=1 Tax=Fulvivirga sedimenti TaxID=2879465 RepID=A0A9X1HV63_9BACT|nr:SRPBCC family protein [Fulvivirga sedimenti]MCA6077950.1 SRPBCC family protein [Fulvivirga sedimenti]